MPTNDGGRTYTFGPFRLDTREGTLLREGRPVQLTPKAFETLVALVERSGHCLGKEELMRRVWPDSFVEENNLSQNISQLRRALHAEGGEAVNYIETVPRRGYRFNTTVVVQEAAPALVDDNGEKVATVLHAGRVEVFAHGQRPRRRLRHHLRRARRAYFRRTARRLAPLPRRARRVPLGAEARP